MWPPSKEVEVVALIGVLLILLHLRLSLHLHHHLLLLLQHLLGLHLLHLLHLCRIGAPASVELISKWVSAHRLEATSCVWLEAWLLLSLVLFCGAEGVRPGHSLRLELVATHHLLLRMLVLRIELAKHVYLTLGDLRLL